MSAEATLHVAAHGDPNHYRVIELVEMMRAATAYAVTDAADPITEMSLLMTAASMFSGALFGQLIALGAADDSHREFRRVSDSMTRNFKSGITAGQMRVARAAKTEGMMQ